MEDNLQIEMKENNLKEEEIDVYTSTQLKNYIKENKLKKIFRDIYFNPNDKTIFRISTDSKHFTKREMEVVKDWINESDLF